MDADSTDEEYEIEKIPDSRLDLDTEGNQYASYLIRWLGLGPDWDEWVHQDCVQAEELLRDFRHRKRRSIHNCHLPRRSESGLASELNPDNDCPEDGDWETLTESGDFVFDEDEKSIKRRSRQRRTERQRHELKINSEQDKTRDAT